jgi:hypothetical protein
MKLTTGNGDIYIAHFFHIRDNGQPRTECRFHPGPCMT